MTIALFAVGVLAVTAALLLVPVDLRFRSAPGEEATGLRVEWLFGRVTRELRGGARRKARTEGRGRDPVAWVRDLAELWNRELQSEVIELLRKLGGVLRVQKLQARVRLGLGDPAETGMAWSVIAPVADAAGALPNVDLLIEPDFVRAGIRGEASGAVRLIPLQLLAPLIAFASSRATRRAARALRSRRRERRTLSGLRRLLAR